MSDRLCCTNWSLFQRSFCVAFLLVMLRYVLANPVDLDLVAWEEACVYLHAAEKSFLDFFLLPDTNYCNFVAKFSAFVSLKIFKAIDAFPLFNTLLNWTIAAFCCVFFLHDRFKIIIPSFYLRLALCSYLYLLPVYDLSVSFNQSYYTVFPLMYIFIVLMEHTEINWINSVCILLIIPFAILGKPSYFFFSIAFVYLMFREFTQCVKYKKRSYARIYILFFIFLLYVFQLFFMIAHHASLGRFTNAVGFASGLPQLLEFYGVKVAEILGYSFICPLAHIVTPQDAKNICFATGLFVALCIIYNFFMCIIKRRYKVLAIILLLVGCVGIGFYGMITVDFLYDRFFIQNVYDAPWGQRMVLPISLLTTVNVVIALQSSAVWRCKILLGCLYMLCALSLCVPVWNSWNAGFQASFRWSQCSSLMFDRFPFIPHAYGFGKKQGFFCYLRDLDFFSDEESITVDSGGCLNFSMLPSNKKIMYILLTQAQGTDMFYLGPNVVLKLSLDGVDYTAILVNPGVNSQYLFKFPEFVPSDKIQGVHIAGAGRTIAGRSLSGLLVGLR